MKTKIFGLTIAAAATVAILSGGIFQSTQAQQDAPPPDAQNNNSAPADALPPDIAANAALVEIINLSQANVSADVINNYINNSQSRFNLTAGQLIYLRDIGVPDSVVIAMQQRDTQLGEPAPQPTQAAAPAPPPTTTVVTEDYFDDSLAPYGNWVVIEGYGRCWRPAVVVYDSNWQPYCDGGHWVWTDCGWYWYSDYSWGWATFHYGRWFHDGRYGWCWETDTVWGPSWVCWRYSDDYCGWAPLPPRCEFREGIGLFFNGSRVSVGFDFGLSIGAFTFVAAHDFCDPHPWQHRVDRTRVTQIYNQTTVINNITVNNNGNNNTTVVNGGGGNRTIVNNGIPVDRIATATHTQIKQVVIRESNSPVRRGERLDPGANSLVINRPHFQPATATQTENRNTPHTIPSPTTGQPMQVPPPGQNRNNSLPPQNRNVAPTENVQPSAGNENRNRNENRNSYSTVTPQPAQPQNQPSAEPNKNERQSNVERFGNTLPQPQTPSQTTPTRNYPSAQSPTETRMPTYTPPANQTIPQPGTPNNSRPDYRSPRMNQQQPAPSARYVAPPATPRNYSEPNNAQPTQRSETPQPSPRVYQAPAPQYTPPSQQSQPSQNSSPDRGRGKDKNDQQ